ncbi:MAG TPA: hypothetical protein VHU88_05900 [Sporichthyaceae bacterium]|jgi:hypothetical protein|nr:hypothetical protein [Sporichthyaceae bacterium]
MPRYRFKWESIPQDLLSELAGELELVDDPLVGLRRRYGARPATQFVRDLWSTLRDGWLSRDPDARSWVAAELRAAGLGDVSIIDDLRYLKSCRNADQLRRTVLVAFHDLGEESPAAAAETAVPEPADHTGVTRRAVAGFDLDSAIDSAWTGFTERLGVLVESLGRHDSFIIGLPTAIDAAQLEGVAPYVQIHGVGADHIRGEVSGNAYLDKRLALSEARQTALVAIGWTAPAEDPGGEFPEGSANFVAEVPRSASAHLVTMTLATIRDVFDVPHPSFLELPGFDRPHRDETPRAAVAQADLRAAVEETLAAYFDHPIVHDEDGDIPIHSGSAMVFVHVSPDVPVVELFSPLLLGTAGDALALERINRANRSIRFAKLTWTGGRVLASYELWCDPFVPELLLWAVGLMMNLADEMDDRLRPELGGRRFFEDAEAPLPQISTDAESMHPALATINQLAPNGSGLTAMETARICAYDRDLVLALIAACEGEAIGWRKGAGEATEPRAQEAGNAEAANWDGIADLLRAALREIVLG